MPVKTMSKTPWFSNKEAKDSKTKVENKLLRSGLFFNSKDILYIIRNNNNMIMTTSRGSCATVFLHWTQLQLDIKINTVYL